MTRIDMCCPSNIDHAWIKKNQGEIQSHPTWHENISKEGSEAILQGKPPFTYILRNGEKEHSYFISFMKMDRTIYHQSFVIELDQKKWYYRNLCTEGPAENLDELIPMMMHCDPMACSPLRSMGQS